jgi:predicted SprT family Zn-dependent metalloprotease
MMNQNRIQEARAITKNWLERARVMFPSFDVSPDTVEITFFAKGRAAGSMYTRTINGVRSYSVRLNREAINEHWDHMVNATIPHEVAHIVAMHLNQNRRIKSHGPEWQKVMLKFGCAPDRCHSLNLSKAREQSKFTYRASCGTEITVSTCLHNKIQRGEVRIIKNTRGKITASSFIGKKK